MGFETVSTTAADWILSVSSSEHFVIENDEANSRPFTIQNGAGNDAFVIDFRGFLGVNEDAPVSALDVKAPPGESAALKVTNTGGADNALHTILNLASNGPPALRLRDNFNNETWQFRAKQNGGFTINNAGTPGLEMQIEKDGRVRFRNSVTVDGVVVHSSSKNLKENLEVIDKLDVLEKVNKLSIQQWNYIRDEDGVKHIGPMAEDFYGAFNLGSTKKGISSVDVSGVALAAIQGLKFEKDVEMTLLQKKLDKKNRALKLQTQQLEELRSYQSKKDDEIQVLIETLNVNKAQLLVLQQENEKKEMRISKLEESLGRLGALEHDMAILMEKPFEGIQQTELFVLKNGKRMAQGL